LKRRAEIVGILGVLLGCVFLASASAAPPLLDTIPVRTSSADEYAAASQGAWFAWAQGSHAHPNHYNVFAQWHGSGPPITVNAPGTSGGLGGIDGDTLVYSEHVGNYAGDIFKFNLASHPHQRSSFPAKVSTRWDEYYPTISGHWVLFTRYLDTTQTTKVLLYNMRTHALRTLGTDRGRRRSVYSGQVNGDYASWGRVRPSGAEVYLYRISTQTNTAIPPVTGLFDYSPSVARDGTIYYMQSGSGCGEAASLVRYAPGGVATVLHDFPAGTDVGDSYVDERADGSLDVFVGQTNCRSDRWDIYKVIDSHTVSVSKAGSGTGRVTSDPAGIYCDADCQSIFHGGVTVTFTASDGPGSVFSGWSDAECGTNPTCAIDIESDVSLTATFNLSP
jgi:hypothetical protein